MKLDIFVELINVTFEMLVGSPIHKRTDKDTEIYSE